MVDDEPASAAKTMMIASPAISVRFGPKREDTTPVISMAMPVTSMYDVKSKDTWLGVASSCSPMGLRIGSTRPMPMKAMTLAKATAQTARGCCSRLPCCSWFTDPCTTVSSPRSMGRDA